MSLELDSLLLLPGYGLKAREVAARLKLSMVWVDHPGYLALLSIME